MIIADQLEFFERYLIAMKEIENFCNDNDKKTKELIKGFLHETYKKLLETIKKIDSALPLMSNSVDYKELKEAVEKLKDYIEEYKWVFVAAGIVKEEEINDNLNLLKEKTVKLNRLMVH